MEEAVVAYIHFKWWRRTSCNTALFWTWWWTFGLLRHVLCLLCTMRDMNAQHDSSPCPTSVSVNANYAPREDETGVEVGRLHVSHPSHVASLSSLPLYFPGVISQAIMLCPRRDIERYMGSYCHRVCDVTLPLVCQNYYEIKSVYWVTLQRTLRQLNAEILRSTGSNNATFLYRIHFPINVSPWWCSG
jgi:hypothetical protein